MTLKEKAEAFDNLALAFTHQWTDGEWSWGCRSPSVGPKRATRAEAAKDLLEWARKIASRCDGKHDLGMI